MEPAYLTPILREEVGGRDLQVPLFVEFLESTIEGKVTVCDYVLIILGPICREDEPPRVPLSPPVPHPTIRQILAGSEGVESLISPEANVREQLFTKGSVQ